ncbi:MAG: DUF5069 domain-containing protein [Verrucomicrobiota bacterium]|nr:DUF5069 domain-containing protein [Verrucomicrobiota bacterium]
MTEFPPRSPAAKLHGIVYVGRMIDKIRLNLAEKLPADYQANLGVGFDGNCTAFLQIDYQQLTKLVATGATDDEVIEWCFAHGRRPSEDEINVWNEFMRKRGWNDEITKFLVRRKRESGWADRAEIETMFGFIDADEGRPLPELAASAPES